MNEASHSAIDAQGPHSGRRGRRIEWRKPPKRLTTSIVDIDLDLKDIVFQRRGDGLEGGRPSSVADYAIEGVARTAEPATAGRDEPDHAVVYVSGYEQSDRLDRGEDVDPRSVCYIAADRRAEAAWRTDIAIERHVFRRLVELFASKRIDFVRLSILMKVTRDASGAIELPTLSRPMLRTAGHGRRQHSRAHLISVQTSMNGARHERAAFVAGCAAWSRREAAAP